MSEEKRGKGRPLLFEDKEELEERIQDYFTLCKDSEDIPTISGLAVHLDTSRETLMNYEHREDYFDTIKKAKDKVVALQEQLAMKNKINPTVWIFSAKNNLGYTDKREVDNTSGGKPLPLLNLNVLLNDSDSEDSETEEED